ncbi:PQQ-dependent sugar dehydrogenase [Streptomyces sp. RFCAC02]|uniref:PQQ-dependent sugar dehydrogenase n=1 Tax=Streptomyces sp. RFCAC02 TaxID=2499143 RepID=UPI0010208759|nr:PQQ-dependent sugar dehydrogenase [Streptomyces sp. RFCAC02]
MVAALVVVAAAAGCSVGPAADRAEREGLVPAGSGEQDPGADDDPGQPEESSPPSDSPESPAPSDEAPEPTQDPAPAQGTATVVDTLAVDSPTSCCVVPLPDGSLLVGSSDTAVIQHVAPDGATTDIGAVNDATALYGIAVEPDFDASGNGWLYVYYAQESTARVARFSYYGSRSPGERLGSSPATLAGPLPLSDRHRGGAMAFGPDGMLYVGTGDAGQPQVAADPESPAGKVLRMEPDGRVPADNPQQGSLVYASGFADVTGLAFDAAGRLWAVDSGAGGGPAVGPVVPGSTSTDVPPVHQWTDSGAQARGLAYAAGSLWVADPAVPALWRLPLDGDDLVAEPQPLLTDDGALTSPQAVQAPADGTVWLLDSAGQGLLGLDVS